MNTCLETRVNLQLDSSTAVIPPSGCETARSEHVQRQSGKEDS